MSIALSLATIFGKPVAEKLMKSLGERNNGTQKFEQASAAMAQGATAIEALKKAFGRDFLNVLNVVIGQDANGKLKYEAGTQAYIPVNSDVRTSKALALRDELNINLDRLSVLEMRSPAMLNMFRGLIAVWRINCLATFNTGANIADIDATFHTIRGLLDGRSKNHKEIFHALSSTAVGGIGALMIIGGVMVATSTGVGVAAAISAFLFGIPFLTVGALVLPGAMLILLASKKSKPADVMSISIALLYKLLERLQREEGK